jgi:hypothetical protein
MPDTTFNSHSNLLEEFIRNALLGNGSRMCVVAGAQLKISQPEFVQEPLEEKPLGALEVVSIRGEPYPLVLAIERMQGYRTEFNREAKRFELYKV